MILRSDTTEGQTTVSGLECRCESATSKDIELLVKFQ